MTVQYTDAGKFTTTVVPVKRVWYVTATALTRGAPLCWSSNALLATFEKGPGVDVKIAVTDNEFFAGIIADDSVGVIGPAWVNLQCPGPGDVVWACVTAATDAGDGLLLAASQILTDSGAYGAGHIGVALMTEDEATNPYAADNLVPVLFSIGVA